MGRQGRGKGGKGRGGGRGKPKSSGSTSVNDPTKAMLKNQHFYNDKPDQAHNFVQVKKKLVQCFAEQCDDGGVMKTAVEDGVPFEETAPEVPLVDGVKKIDQSTEEGHHYHRQFLAWEKRQETCNEHKVKASAVMRGQCTKAVTQKLEAIDDWKNVRDDPMQLLKAIQSITQDADDETCHTTTVYNALRRLVNIKQQEDEGLSACTQRFKSVQQVFETKFGPINVEECAKLNPKCIKLMPADPNDRISTASEVPDEHQSRRKRMADCLP